MEQSPFASRRKHKRHNLRDLVTVTNQLTGETMGTVANLSQEGIMLVNNQPLAAENIYQIRLQVAEGVLGDGPTHIDIGIDCLWVSPANANAATYWSGCQIIDVSDESHDRILEIIRKLGE